MISGQGKVSSRKYNMSEAAEILPNIVTEYENDGVKSPEDKARNRMVAEGYKYQALNGNKTEELGEVENLLLADSSLL